MSSGVILYREANSSSPLQHLRYYTFLCCFGAMTEVKSYTEWQTVRHHFNIYASIPVCVWR